MEFDPQEQEVIRLLTRLKDAGGEYPADLLAARRQKYLTQMAGLGLGIGAARGLADAAKHGSTAAPATATSSFLETALVVAIVVEAAAVAYFYRDQLSSVLQTIRRETRVQGATPLPVAATGTEIQGVTPSPAVTATLPSPTIALSPSETATPLASSTIPGASDRTNPGVNQAGSTPVPDNNTNSNNTNQGNHYGQTPKPERTKAPQENSKPPPAQKPTKTK